MNFPFKFFLGEEAVEVQLGPWVVRRVRYDDIESMRNGHPIWNEHWLNFWPWRYLCIRRKTGWIKNFVINPTPRDVFAAELKRRAKLP